MFDITPDDIAQLNDSDLRELVGRLCEAELSVQGHSTAGVTWGGHQNAKDGGLDVRVELSHDVSIEGFIPRPSTGFQVKASDMPRSAILDEMCPEGTIRHAIQGLAHEEGAYIMVSSQGSLADNALQNRRNALREALINTANAVELHTDFYDRTRLATWVRSHAGVIAWVKEKVGRAHSGWHPYGPWSGVAEGIDAEYLFDDTVRLRLGAHYSERTTSVAQGIDQIREELAQPGKILRLVGLSGVGKTRLVQALFDAQIGTKPLPSSLAIYTNLSDNPDPQPTGLASDLIAKRMQAVLIIDNCPPDLHRRLSDLCCGPNSTVSVLTVEYDVRDDQPEGTHVIVLDTASSGLIEQLVGRRYPHLSQVDARTIADVSGGNARIAIALAETIEQSETIAGLTNDELFQRLFQQRRGTDHALLLAAEVCSLVYSFHGEAMTGDEAEIPRLALLAGQSPSEIYRHVSELFRRDLAQRRGVWRAVLPHAIANHLAARALENIPYEVIDEQLISRGTKRLAQSFSRRLSYLHDHPRAVAIVERWLAPNGLLGDVSALNDLGRAMFENVTPVLPEAALAALERAGNCNSDLAATVWLRHLSLLRSLAYDPALFERSTKMLVRAATQSMEEQQAKQAKESVESLFAIYLSGTHATIKQRLSVVESLLRSSEKRVEVLGLTALDAILRTGYFSAFRPFEFGARSRNFGYQPQSSEEHRLWYSSALTLIEHLALKEGLLVADLRKLLARNFSGLWTSVGLYCELETLSHQFAAAKFWREGWLACRRTLHFHRDQLTPESAARLSALEDELKPSTVCEQVHAIVLGNWDAGFDLEDTAVDSGDPSAFEALEVTARNLGAAVANDEDAFEELLPELLHGGTMIGSFGRGLAGAAADIRATWTKLVEALDCVPVEQRDVSVLKGFLAEISLRDRNLVQDILDSVFDHSSLVVFLPSLQQAVGLDEAGVARLERALTSDEVPIWRYQNLAIGCATDQLASCTLKKLLFLIAAKPEGFDVALKILYVRLRSDRSDQQPQNTDLLEVGQELLRRVTFRGRKGRSEYEIAGVVNACLADPNATHFAAELAARLKQAVMNQETSVFDNPSLLYTLLQAQPLPVLDALFAGDRRSKQIGIMMFDYNGFIEGSPADVISCEDLVNWCEGECESRYSLAASIITFACRPETNGPLVWSDQAKALLTRAPDPRSVLEALIDRFWPRSWLGSRAGQMEANAGLLDTVEEHIPATLVSFVIEEKTKLQQAIAQERQRETTKEQESNERFE